MRKPAVLCFVVAAITLITVPAWAADPPRIPWVSPAATVAQTIGITDVEVSYHRPAVKGRAVWGGLVPWGEVWRLGANEATTISFSTPVKVEGHDVPAGTYALFAIPGQETWTLVLNQQAKQWGAYFYKQDQDVLRFDVKPVAGSPTEWMAFSITPVSADAAVVEMAWEGLRVPFRVTAETDKLVWAGIDAALAADPDADTYLVAINYALQTETRLDEAMTWTDRSLALQEGFWAHERKAKLLQRQGKTAEAVKHLDRAQELAKGKAPQAYIDGLEKLEAEWTTRRVGE